MIVAGQRLPVLIATRPVDFRCGHQALALMVQTELKLDLRSGATVVFRSQRGDRLKILIRVSHGRASGSSGHGARPEWFLFTRSWNRAALPG